MPCVPERRFLRQRSISINQRSIRTREGRRKHSRGQADSQELPHSPRSSRGPGEIDSLSVSNLSSLIAPCNNVCRYLITCGRFGDWQEQVEFPANSKGPPNKGNRARRWFVTGYIRFEARGFIALLSSSVWSNNTPPNQILVTTSRMIFIARPCLARFHGARGGPDLRGLQIISHDAP